ncbi:YfhO family protein [Secundilactobacillus folii]|uniref:YfhO family protein n=1 Tax=Secundilactobacillus folii TaxID=2678357 RepID=A0A7X2XUU0_9LACO|nr:YfhO family protein [Secundilactobacillus folii]MTV81373.1 YfhO family protein [Secundilactobacillus folii]
MRKVYEKIPVWVVYSIAFVFVVVCSFGVLRLNGQTNIWSVDGIAQHYPILEEFYRILRGTAHQSLFGWSWNLGLGADQMTTFAYYVVGDPFSYLIALFPAGKIELGFQLLTILRLYFVGLAFLVFARQMHLKRSGSLISSLIYTFCSYSFYVSFHHPFFLLPMIFFPLLCVAIDKIYHGQSFLWLVAITAIALISNVYFAYLLGLGSLAFAIIRYIDLKRKGELVRSLPRSLGYFVATVVMALMIAAMVLLPNILSMLNSSRSGSSNFANGLKFYPPIYYMKLPNAILNSNGQMYYWVVMGTAGLSLIAMIWSLRHFKRYLMINITFLLIAVALLLPQFAAIMNVMSTPSNRWVMLTQLLFALVSGLFIDHLQELDLADFKWFVWGTVILLALVWLGNGFSFDLSTHHLIMYGIYLMTLVVVGYGILGGLKGARMKYALLAMVIVNTASAGISFYSTDYSPSANSELSRGVATHWTSAFYDYANRYLAKHDRSFYRTATTTDYYSMGSAGNNIPMLLNMHSISSYFSVQSGTVNKFNQTLRNSENTMNNPTRNVDNRTTMSSLLNVKYLFARADEVGQSKIPYGFKIVKSRRGKVLLFHNKLVYGLDNNSGTVIYRNPYALPLAYTQTAQLNNSAYHKLSAPNKEQALLDGALTSQKASGVKTVKAATTAKTVPYTVQMRSLPITTLGQAGVYRLTHNTTASLVRNPTFSNVMSPVKDAQYRDYAQLQHPSNSIVRLLEENRSIVAANNAKNQHGLKEMTSDDLGQNAYYTITLKNPSAYQNSELYIEFDGIKTRFPSTKTRLSYRARRAMLANVPFSKGQKLRYWRYYLNHGYFKSYAILVRTMNKRASVQQLGINNMSDYEKKGSALLNLGYSTKARTHIHLAFYRANQISFKHVRIIAVPFGQSYKQKTARLQKQSLGQLKVTNDQVTGTSNNRQASVLTTSIPYSKGWQLTVDGKPTATQKVNVGFVGAKIPAGNHQIRLTYQTPGLKVGRLVSAIGITAFLIGLLITLGLAVIRKQRK